MPSTLSARTTLRQVIYTSRAVPRMGLDTVATIFRRAREFNASHGITGALLYDGHLFAHWLIGPAVTVTALMERIARDPRHEAMLVLLDEPADGTEFGSRWHVGYALPDALNECSSWSAGPREAVVQGFRSLLPNADVWPPLQEDSETADPAQGGLYSA